MSPSVECLDRIWCDKHVRTVIFHWTESRADHTFVLKTHWHVYTCIHLHKSVYVCVCVCLWGGGGGGCPIRGWKRPCSIVVGLEGIWVSLWNRESQTEEEGDRLSSAAYPCQHFSLHQLFSFSSRYHRCTVWKEGRDREKTGRGRQRHRENT